MATKYRPIMNDKIIELMTQGASLIEVSANLDISRDTIHDWTNKDSPRYKKKFSDTIKRGIELSEAWWLKLGREKLTLKYQSDNLNFTGWYMNMKNRFGWKDKQDVTSNNKTIDTVIMLPSNDTEKKDN